MDIQKESREVILNNKTCIIPKRLDDIHSSLENQYIRYANFKDICENIEDSLNIIYNGNFTKRNIYETSYKELCFPYIYMRADGKTKDKYCKSLSKLIYFNDCYCYYEDKNIKGISSIPCFCEYTIHEKSPLTNQLESKHYSTRENCIIHKYNNGKKPKILRCNFHNEPFEFEKYYFDTSNIIVPYYMKSIKDDSLSSLFGKTTIGLFIPFMLLFFSTIILTLYFGKKYLNKNDKEKQLYAEEKPQK